MNEKIVLWGSDNCYFDFVLSLLIEAGFNVVGAVYHREDLHHYSLLEIGKYYYVSLKSSFKRMKKMLSISANKLSDDYTVVCALVAEDEKSDFLKAMDFCYERKINFLHPAFLLDKVFWPDPVTNKVKCYGFHGSGNVLTHNFLNLALPEAKPSRREQLLSHLANHYYQLIDGEISKIFKIHDQESGFKSSYGYLQRDMGLYNAEISELRVSLLGFPMPAYAWDRTLISHDIACLDDINFFDKLKFKQVAIIRNPLDVIHANIDWQLLSNPVGHPLIKVVIDILAQYMRHQIENKDRLHLIRYETLLQHESTDLCNFLNLLRLKPDRNLIIKWQEQLLYRQLPGVSSDHFRGGGAKKWLGLYTQETYNYLEQSGIIDMAAELGYCISRFDFVSGADTSDISLDSLNYYERSIRALVHLGLVPSNYNEYKTLKGVSIFYLFPHALCETAYNLFSHTTHFSRLIDAFYYKSPSRRLNLMNSAMAYRSCLKTTTVC